MTEKSVQNKQYDEFLFRVTGYLLEPINKILETSNDLMKEEENPNAQIIQNERYLLLNLVNDIRDYAEMQTGRTVLEIKLTDLNELLSGVVEIAETMLKSKLEVEFQKGGMGDLPKAKVQAVRVQQILLNLVHNAVKFTDQGHICLSVSKENGAIVFEVEDSGVGIPKEEQRHVFAPFETALQEPDDQRVGLRLGLPISKYIAESYGGRIWFESEEEKGTKFYFSLPIW